MSCLANDLVTLSNEIIVELSAVFRTSGGRTLLGYLFDNHKGHKGHKDVQNQDIFFVYFVIFVV